MLDHSDLPQVGTGTFFTLDGNTASTAQGWVPWSKPRGVTMLSITTIGGGGGGGGGFTAAAGAARGGGSGGGSGGISRLIIPAILVPDVLYLLPGLGGPGGNAAAAGTAGVASHVAIWPSTAGAHTLCVANGGGAGAAGTGTAGGTAGTAGAIATAANTIMGQMGLWVPLAGQAGAAGGAQTGVAGGSVTVLSAHINSGGAGGGGVGTANTDFAGGNQTDAGLIPKLTGGLAAAGAGQAGASWWQPMMSTGGTGGGTAGASGTAGAGGGGGRFGSGGAGGGGGVTGGAGGRGGPGFILITAW